MPEDCEVHILAERIRTTPSTRSSGSPRPSARPTPTRVLQPAHRPDRPTGPITGATIADALGALLPEGAIVADEAQTGGLWAAGATAGAPRHDWLTLTGGSIGMGMPLATGAALPVPTVR